MAYCVARSMCRVAKSKVAKVATSCLCAGGLVFLRAGLMSKPMVVTLPFTLLLVDFWPLDGCNFKFQISELQINRWAAASKKSRSSCWRWRLCAVTFWHSAAAGAVSADGMVERFGNAPSPTLRYLGKCSGPTISPSSIRIRKHWPAAAHRRGRCCWWPGFPRSRSAAPAQAAVARGRLVLVSRHAGPGHRPRAGRRAIHGRPLYLYSEHWTFPRAGVGRDGILFPPGRAAK